MFYTLIQIVLYPLLHNMPFIFEYRDHRQVVFRLPFAPKHTWKQKYLKKLLKKNPLISRFKSVLAWSNIILFIARPMSKIIGKM